MSASDAPPAKRARTDDSSSTPVRSTIWHHDGSVVLEASGTQFRVHWSILTTHSSIFKDMYSVPQPDAPGPMVEGCPVVELHDDPKDLEYVLGALYNPMLLGQKSFPFDVVAAFVRLGRKYDFADLRKVGIERLEAENPSTLAGYVAVEARKFKLQHIQYRAGYRVDVVNLLQEQQLISSLPYAYYVLACTRKVGVR
ncbi:BTB domain-containing protein [Mycena chlorophos]|uniref:BTB domain-containing protein n=1 Tax=Mycena chlorophos TaxID=658473 RepID=A0A8H6SEE4_MYCCL|nr:BTB domain-containing protein [Mycena chlorophos]